MFKLSGNKIKLTKFKEIIIKKNKKYDLWMLWYFIITTNSDFIHSKNWNDKLSIPRHVHSLVYRHQNVVLCAWDQRDWSRRTRQHWEARRLTRDHHGTLSAMSLLPRPLSPAPLGPSAWESRERCLWRPVACNLKTETKPRHRQETKAIYIFIFIQWYIFKRCKNRLKWR